jgi:hypothetical protein
VTCGLADGCLVLTPPAPSEANNIYMSGIAPNGVDGIMPTLAGTGDLNTTQIPATDYMPAVTIFDNGAMAGNFILDNNGNYAFTWASPIIRYQMGVAPDSASKYIVILSLPTGSTMTLPGGQTTIAEESAALPPPAAGAPFTSLFLMPPPSRMC